MFAVLDYLAVHPDNWRKGIGSALVESGLSQAKELGADVFVLAFKAGHKVYKNAGLIEVDKVVEYDTNIFPDGDGEHGAWFFVSKVYEPKGKTEKEPKLVEGDIKPSEDVEAATIG